MLRRTNKEIYAMRNGNLSDEFIEVEEMIKEYEILASFGDDIDRDYLLELYRYRDRLLKEIRRRNRFNRDALGYDCPVTMEENYYERQMRNVGYFHAYKF